MRTLDFIWGILILLLFFGLVREALSGEDKRQPAYWIKNTSSEKCSGISINEWCLQVPD